MKRKNAVLCALSVVVWATCAYAQVSYDDVAVIVNVNSASSQLVGNYFKAARNIPAVNMIYVSADTVEEIDSVGFNQLRAQVEQHLVNNNLVNTINYLVTTKGVPLKVNRGNIGAMNSPSSSVESDLALILGPYSSSIGAAGYVISPYFYQQQHFSRAAYGIYLVTRLDAYTDQEAVDLIDRSGPGVVVPSAAKFVLDQDPLWYDLRFLNEFMKQAKDTLVARGRPVLLDSTTTYLVYNNNVLGYASWGSNDHNANQYTQYAIPHNTYVPGALAETFVSTSGRSFDRPPVYGQSLIADLVHEGVSGAKGYVYEPFALAMARPNVLFGRYTEGYNLAESYYAASIFLSWMDVVVGDPKTSITVMTGPLPVQLASFTGTLIENNRVRLNWMTISEINNYGFYVQRRSVGVQEWTEIANSFVPGHGTTNEPQYYSFTDPTPITAATQYRLRQVDLDGTSHYSDPIQVDLPTSVPEVAPREFALKQNYPNPFNPSTEIKFSVENTGHAKLDVYNALGQKVATLFDGVAEAGQYYTVRFTATGLSSGVYFYRLESGKRSDVKKLVLMK
jgi:uncharacterized protein (TIGR03790 family)